MCRFSDVPSCGFGVTLTYGAIHSYLIHENAETCVIYLTKTILVEACEAFNFAHATDEGAGEVDTGNAELEYAQVKDMQRAILLLKSACGKKDVAYSIPYF